MYCFVPCSFTMTVFATATAGGGACIPGVAAMLGKKLHLPVEVFNPLETFPPTKLSAIGPNEAPLLATAFGLSTRRF